MKRDVSISVLHSTLHLPSSNANRIPRDYVTINNFRSIFFFFFFLHTNTFCNFILALSESVTRTFNISLNNLKNNEMNGGNPWYVNVVIRTPSFLGTVKARVTHAFEERCGSILIESSRADCRVTAGNEPASLSES